MRDGLFERSEWILLGVVVALKLALLVLTPLTGDEAYFITWAQLPAFGYYDHPPVVGWAIYLLAQLSDSYLFFRLSALFASLAIAWALYRLLVHEVAPATARSVALLFFVSPISLMMFLVTNDIFLALFGVLGFVAFVRALARDSVPLALLAGVLIGLAFLSKYFAVFLAAGLLLSLLVARGGARARVPLAAFGVAGLFALENLAYNLCNCWDNVLFNFVSRTRSGGLDPANLALFAAFIVLLIPPQGLRALAGLRWRGLPPVYLQAICVAGPFLAVLLLLSLVKEVGLHWLLLAVPFVYLLFARLDARRLRGMVRYNAVLSIVLGVGLLLVVLFHRELLGESRYSSVAVYTQTAAICAQLPAGETIYTSSYSKHAVLAYHCADNPFHVMFSTSRYGREDDKRVDFRALDGADLTVYATRRKELERIAAYFETVEATPIRVDEGVEHYLLRGRGFDYPRYREQVLKVVADAYYTAPGWLPAARCAFTERYSL